jgi:FkbM family methyltransferase
MLRRLKTAFLRPIRSNAQRHGVGSAVVSRFCRFYLDWYENSDPDAQSNGEFVFLGNLDPNALLTVFDVGANRGDWTAAICDLAPGASVHAFEPHPKLQGELRRRFGDIARVSIVPAALSDKEGTAQLHFDPHRSAVSSLHNTGVGLVANVQTLTGDAYCTRHGIDRIDLLKVDAEGHDLAVLRGFARMLRDGRIGLTQFEHNEMSVYSRTLLKDFFDFLGPSFTILKIMPYGLERIEWSLQRERFRYGNYVATQR